MWLGVRATCLSLFGAKDRPISVFFAQAHQQGFWPLWQERQHIYGCPTLDGPDVLLYHSHHWHGPLNCTPIAQTLGPMETIATNTQPKEGQDVLTLVCLWFGCAELFTAVPLHGEGRRGVVQELVKRDSGKGVMKKLP